MSKKMVMFLTTGFLGILLTSCQIMIPTSYSNTHEPIKKTITGVASTTKIDLTSSLAPTSVPTTISSPTTALLPSPTPKYTPSPTPLSLERLQERGSLWMLLNNRTGYFDRLNLDNSEITPIRAGGFCSSILPGTEEVVCGYPGRYILRNLVTGGEQQLPIENTCRFYGWSPNGRFLIYEYCKPDGSYRLTTYDLVTQIEQEVASFSQSFGEREWNTIPLISYDGEHLIAGGKTVFEIDPKTLERHPIGVLEPLTTWDIALSPTANQIVYGVTDIFQEIGSFPNYLYLYDFDSGENSLLATAPEGNVYDWFFSTPIWSPDGSKVVVASGSYLCVIEIILLEQTCHDLFPYEGLSSMTWSPGSQYIAIDAGYWGNPISDLIIYDVAKGSYFVLISGLELENEILNVLFWR